MSAEHANRARQQCRQRHKQGQPKAETLFLAGGGGVYPPLPGGAVGPDALGGLPLPVGRGRVQPRVSHPVGASPTEANRLRPRSTGGAGARKPAGEALRQPAWQGAGARLQVATCRERRGRLGTRNSGGRAGLLRAQAARAERKESATAVRTGGVSAATGSAGGERNWSSPWCPAKKARGSGRASNREGEGAGMAPGWRIGW